MSRAVVRVELRLRSDRILMNAELLGDRIDPAVQGAVRGGGLVRLGQNPAEEGIEPEAGGGGIAGAGDVGLQLDLRIGFRVRAEVLGEVGEFVAEEEGPGIRRELLGGDGMDEDGAVGQRPADPDQGAGVFAKAEVPIDLPAGGPCDLAGDGLEFAEVRRGAVARVGPRLHAAAVRGGCGLPCRWRGGASALTRSAPGGAGGRRWAGISCRGRGGKCQGNGKGRGEGRQGHALVGSGKVGRHRQASIETRSPGTKGK